MANETGKPLQQNTMGRCEDCGQLCPMDYAWTVNGVGNCCREAANSKEDKR